MIIRSVETTSVAIPSLNLTNTHIVTTAIYTSNHRLKTFQTGLLSLTMFMSFLRLVFWAKTMYTSGESETQRGKFPSATTIAHRTPQYLTPIFTLVHSSQSGISLRPCSSSCSRTFCSSPASVCLRCTTSVSFTSQTGRNFTERGERMTGGTTSQE